jgi:prevent-host-death family protein
MSKRRASALTARPPRKTTRGDSVGAAEFKARCLELMDRVRETGTELVITKRGKPVAKLVPFRDVQRKKRLFGCMKGTVLKYERPLDPIDADWDINRD